MTLEDRPHKVVAVAVPVLAGVGATLHEMVRVGGQVMVTCPCTNTKGAIASHPARTHIATLLVKGCPWGLEP